MCITDFDRMESKDGMILQRNKCIRKEKLACVDCRLCIRDGMWEKDKNVVYVVCE